ncbi:MAG: UDP-N-acetylmuramate--L-alanine ligase [Patescibacteria group bacterium]|nr:UDP-N-acetylmuramate--L-alanine ligase [Patescibacteria group bacterium]
MSKIKKVYFIGIKGVAMSGLAVICKQRGLEVCGSDVSEKFITDKILTKHDIEVVEEFLPQNLDCNPDLVVIGTSWGAENIEVAESQNRGLLTISDSELRGILSLEKRTIAVTGVHGKTTTTAMIAHVFNYAGLRPSFLVGTGTVPDLQGNAAWSNGQHFIVEGDEYVRSKQEKVAKFLDLTPAISVITSLEWEHVDVYPDLATLESAFGLLVDKTRDLVVACGDWPSVKKIFSDKSKPTIRYGFEDGNDFIAYDLDEGFDQTSFKLKNANQDLGSFTINLFGRHNVLNAVAAILVGRQEGIALPKIEQALKTFHGTERRFDISQKNDMVFVDDYGHHPTEIKTTLQAVRHRYPTKKIWCVFQPHMVSRTKALLADFSQSFGDVDRVIFADIFASAREQGQDFTSRDLADVTRQYHQDVVYVGDLNETINYLRKNLPDQVVLVTMGAGDVYRVRDKLMI